MSGRVSDDRGSIIPLVALCMVGLLAVVAVVVDLGYTRAVREQARAAADAGSTAGAVALTDAVNAVAACQDAFAYTFKSLGGSEPSASTIATACTPFSTVCAPGTSRTATLTASGATVAVTNPVPDGDALMNATVLGSGVSQTLNSDVDGVPCDRVGVQVSAPQGSFFRGILGTTSSTYTIHSVALRTSKPGKGETTPALVALNQSACKAIDSGNGVIYLIGNSNGPGIAYSDSNGPTCSQSNPIISGGSSGQVCAESSISVGQIGWFEAPNSRGYNTGTPAYSTADAVCGTSTLKQLSLRRVADGALDSHHAYAHRPDLPLQYHR